MEGRENKTWANFDGKTVVSGVCAQDENMCLEMDIAPFMLLRDPSIIERSYEVETLSSVKASDFHAYKWCSFSCIMTTRDNHTEVSVNNKLFLFEAI